MKSRLVVSAWIAVLLAVLWLSHSLRVARAPATFGTGIGPSTQQAWWIDDAPSAYHLRRIELGLLRSELPTEDRFLGTPAKTPIALRPFPDAALSTFAGLVLGPPPLATDGDLAGPVVTDDYEARLEHLLVRIGPWLGVWTTLLVALGAAQLARFMTRDQDQAWGTLAWPAALLGALVFATSPLAVWYGSAGRVDPMAIVLALLALHTVLVLLLLQDRPSALEGSSRRGVDGLWGALGAGGVAGLALLSWAPALAVVFAAGVALLWATGSPDQAAAKRAARTGLLYFCAAAAVSVFPAITSPWNEAAPASLLHLTAILPAALVAMAAAFVVPLLITGAQGATNRWGNKLGFALFAIVVCAVLVVASDASAAPQGTSFLALPEQQLSLVAVGGGSLVTGVLTDLGWIGLLAPLLALALLWSLVAHFRSKDKTAIWDQGPSLFLLLSLVLVGGLCLEARHFGGLGALFLGVSLGAGLPLLWRGRSGRSSLALTSLGLAACLLQARSGWSFAGMDDLRERRSETVQVLRELRPANGAWSSPELRPKTRILAAWGLGPLAVYHSRRALMELAPNHITNPSPEALLLGNDPALFHQQLTAREVDYVLVTARQAMGLGTMAQGVIPAEDSMAWRLGTFSIQPPIPGFELVHRTLGEEHLPGGAAVGPVLSIWRRLTL